MIVRRTPDIHRSRYERRLAGMTQQEIADQDGVTDGAVQQSIAKYAARIGMPSPRPRAVVELLTGAQLATALGVSDDKIGRWNAKGILPFERYGKTRRYLLDAVRAALSEHEDSKARDKEARENAEKRCSICKDVKPRASFLTVTSRAKTPKQSDWTGPSSECRDCRKDQRREWRRKKAADAGKSFMSLRERAWRRAEKALLVVERTAQRQAAWQASRRHRQESSTLMCARCKEAKGRAGFSPGELRYCKPCVRERDAAKFKRDMEKLTDAYVKRMLTKHTGLRWKDIPPVLIEAKRAQLMLQRVVNPRRKAIT